jgi:putative transposase
VPEQRRSSVRPCYEQRLTLLCEKSATIAAQGLSEPAAGATVIAMARMSRSGFPDGQFHLTASGAGGIHIFRADLDRLEFLHALGIVVDRCGWRLLVYCLMGTHYHLVVDAKADRLSAAMRWLNSVHAQGFNKRHERRGHLFGARYDVRAIRDETHLRAATRYILDNPVRAGLCPRAEDWPWSYVAAEAGAVAA